MGGEPPKQAYALWARDAKRQPYNRPAGARRRGMLRRAVSGWRVTSAAIAAGAVAGLVLTGCGAGSSETSSEPSGNFKVDVATATFPPSQHLAQHAEMVITIRNPGANPIPDIAVTITDAGDGTGAQAFSEDLHAPGLASQSRPVWILDQAPCPANATDITSTGECAPTIGGVPQTGGPGGAVTAYSNTWAMGRLAAGRSTTFKWGVTAVQPGVHVIHYQVAAGLGGKAKAVYGGGQPIDGTFVVDIASKPQQQYVNDAGKVVVVP